MSSIPKNSTDVCENEIYSVGKRIQHHRKEQGLTREQFAEKCGLSVQAIAMIESGSRNFRIQTLITISRVLGLSADYLLGLSDYDEDENILALLSTLQPGDKEFIKSVIKAYIRLDC